jgi:putative transposase
VKLIVNLKLKPLDSQIVMLHDTMFFANEACNWISEQAFQNKIFKQFNIHKLVYKSVRERFPLSAQTVVRAIAKVADSYKIQTAKQTAFKMFGSIAYDDRIISFKKDDLVSIWTTHGRTNIPFVMGEHQRKLFAYRKGEVDLIRRRGIFYLNCVCDVPEDSPLIPNDILGVDFGIVNLATDSTGETFSSVGVEAVRQKYTNQRQRLQHKASKQSQSGKRPRSIHKLLKRLGGREKDFRKHQNHIISKRLVEKAKAQNCTIAIENLKGIRQRTEKRLRKNQRAKHSGWGFYQLRAFLEYKAKLNGVQIVAVCPRYTSQTCHACGHCEKANRKSQSEFECVNCHHKDLADFNAALNIRGKALVAKPQESENIVLPNAVQLQAQSPDLLSRG